VSALLLEREKPSSDELAQVRARGLRHDQSGIGEFARGQRSAGHQGQEHVRSRWIPISAAISAMKGRVVML
jgi:hypothetical protein